MAGYFEHDHEDSNSIEVGDFFLKKADGLSAFHGGLCPVDLVPSECGYLSLQDLTGQSSVANRSAEQQY
jgi:hypothetical protein